MTKAIKHLSIATVTAGMLVASMTGAIAQESADPHHPKGPTAAGVLVAQAQSGAPEEGATPTQAEGNGKKKCCEMMKKMKEKMQKKREKMMGGGMMMQPKGDNGPSSQAFNGITAKMHQDMAITFTGNADVDFVKLMIPHHQAAVDMAKVVLAFGKDPEVKKVAQSVIKTEGAQLAWMNEWLKKQGQ